MLRDELIEALVKAGVSSPRLEADIILKNTAPDYPEYNKEEANKAYSYLKRRIAHEPMDKIIGHKEFYKYDFITSKDVLSPRPDTEILVEKALTLINKNQELSIADFGTGSGCILLSILKECPKALGIGIDISEKAIQIAKENAKKLDISNVQFINTSWTKLDENLKFDIIVSNPPYIPDEEIKTLDIEVRQYDPLLALSGGKDGYDCYKEIARIVLKYLKNDGYILLEAGYNQADKIVDIFTSSGFKFVEFARDLSGIKRCVILKK